VMGFSTVYETAKLALQPAWYIKLLLILG